MSLYKEVYSSGSQYLYIKYGFDGAEELMQKAYEGVKKAKREDAGSNIDGL